MKKINIFIHTYKVNDWKPIRDEQLEYINNSGLKDVSDVHICHYDTFIALIEHPLTILVMSATIK